MTWLQTIPTILIAGLIVFIPGGLLGRCLGARGLTWAATAAPLTVALASVGAISARKLHIGWSLGALAGITLLCCLLAVGVRLPGIVRRRKESHGKPPWIRPKRSMVLAVTAGVAAPALILFIRFSKIFISPENISQTYDNVFHLNAIRFILNTGNGSSLSIGSLNPAVTSSFYPAAWHDLAALVVSTAGVPIPVGVNALNMVLGALVWTLASLYLATRVLGSRPAVFLATGALVAGFNAFPYLLMEFGVLYPNFLAIAVLPVFMGLAADVVKLSASPHPKPWLAAVLFVVALPGLALSHPSVLMALGIFALAPLLTWLVVTVKNSVLGRTAWPWALGATAVTVVYVLVLNYFWGVIRPSKAASFWPPLQTIPQAIGEALTSGTLGRPMPWLAATLMLIGVYAVFRQKRGFWVLGAYCISAFLFVVVSAFEKNDLRNFFTGVWYNDSNRLAAMIPVFALPLAIMGAVWLVDLAAGARRNHADKIKTDALRSVARSRNAGLVVGAVAWIGLIVLTQGFAIATAQGKARITYELTPESTLLTEDEHALLLRLDAHVPEDGMIIDNAGTGAALAYALADRQVILPAVGSSASVDDSIVLGYLPSIGKDPAICDSVKRLNAFYILDFGAQEVNGMTHVFPTSESLAGLPGLKLLDREGDAKLYQIMACG